MRAQPRQIAVSLDVPLKIFSTLLWLLLVCASAQAAPNTFWQAQSIYQIFTDRFFDGDAANNNASGSYNASSGTGVHGGDFRGIEQKLDYIKALGCTAIWISPIVKNGNGEYHGYSGSDFYSVDPHWGTISNLQVMINAAHARGLLVIQDVVVNHGSTLNNINGNTAFNYPGGYNLSYANSSKKYAAPFNTNSVNPSLTNLFHNYGAIMDFNNTQQVELGELSGLDDFRTETGYVRTNMAAIYNYWITNAGFDGFRVDTVKHAEMGFWQDWCPRIHNAAAAVGKTNFFMFGEVFDGTDAKVGSYSGTNGGGAFKLDSLLDYPLFFAAQNVFENGGNTKQLEDHYNNLAANYDTNTTSQLVTFLDNHDTTRFLNSANANGDTNKLAVALAFLHTARGIPCVYQGTEQAFNGGADPNNREDMFAGQFKDAGQSGVDSFNLTHPLFQFIAKLNNFRRLYPALALGAHVNQWNNSTGAGLFAYSRRLGTQEIFVVFNTAASTQTLPNRSITYAPATALVNLLDTNEVISVLAGSLTPTISVPPTTAKIFIAQSQTLPLDPVVQTNFPAHAAANVSVFAPIVLQFSKPMNTNSVQAAFATAPTTTGNFSWSANATTLTFTPSGTGFAPLTNITVTVSNGAVDAGSGNALTAPYQLLFQTAAAPPVMYFSSPASDGLVISLATNTTYLFQVCYTPTLNTNTASLFNLTVNGVAQPPANFIFRPVGAVSGCPGLRSLLYNWTSTSPGMTTGSNLLQIIYSNNLTGVVLGDARTVIVPPPLTITGLVSNAQQVVWSSTPGVNYQVLATTNLTQPFAPVSGTISANSLTTSYADMSNTPPATQKFYEIKVVP